MSGDAICACGGAWLGSRGAAWRAGVGSGRALGCGARRRSKGGVLTSLGRTERVDDVALSFSLVSERIGVGIGGAGRAWLG